MSYYTNKDRKKALEIRQRKQIFKQLIQSPQDAFDILGVAVPHVADRPTFSEYGLTEDTADNLKQSDEKYIQGEKHTRRTVAIIVTLILIIIFYYFMQQGDSKLHPENYNDYRLINNFVGWGGAISSIGGLIIGACMWAWAFDIKPKETDIHRKYKKYQEQLRYFEYWERKKNKDYWNELSGHSFELSVANLFRNIGYEAVVSNRGGDGGVDIILTKNSRKIAVQCKRYKNPVGPHIIRDLWGTMQYLGFEEGCIITTNGFTSGVKDFAKDKRIYLIDLNDILKATNDSIGGKVLAQKIQDFSY